MRKANLSSKQQLLSEKIKRYIEDVGYPELRKNDLLHEKYRILKFISEGTFGKVFKCLDIETKQEIAIKICRTGERFKHISEQEIHNLRLVGQKPYIVKLIEEFDFYIDQSNFKCLVFENLHRSLASVLQANALSIKDTKVILTQILKGLGHLSSLNLIHCDIKPANIMIQTLGKLDIKIIDLGSCSQAGKIYIGLTSLHYMAPEIPLRQRCSLKTDMWAIGLLVLQMLTKEILFNGVNKENQLLELILKEIGPVPPGLHDVYNYKMRCRVDEYGQKTPHACISNITKEKDQNRKTLDQLLTLINKPLVASFVMACLKWKQEDRLSIQEAMQHEFITPQDSRFIKFLRFCTKCPNPCNCFTSTSLNTSQN